jgi:hypothetical protein
VKKEVFEDMRVLESYCQADVTVARSVPHLPQILSTDRECRRFSREFDDRVGL